MGHGEMAKLEDTRGIKKENPEPHTVVKSRRRCLARDERAGNFSKESVGLGEIIRTICSFIHPTNIY